MSDDEGSGIHAANALTLTLKLPRFYLLRVNPCAGVISAVVVVHCVPPFLEQFVFVRMLRESSVYVTPAHESRQHCCQALNASTIYDFRAGSIWDFFVSVLAVKKTFVLHRPFRFCWLPTHRVRLLSDVISDRRRLSHVVQFWTAAAHRL